MYIRVTDNLERCLYEHKNKLVAGFTNKYNVSKLVYCEETPVRRKEKRAGCLCKSRTTVRDLHR
jgi:predicted GIY-YIG superfamily endonuclease